MRQSKDPDEPHGCSLPPDGSDNAGVTSFHLLFCDFRCRHASFPQEGAVDGANSCRTFAAVWCDALGEYVAKNAPCALRFGRRRPKATW